MDTILVVDDKKVNRDILHKILQDEYEVISAESGREALSILKEHSEIGVVLLDIVMPEMDGFQVMKAMKKDCKMSRIPIVIQTETQNAEFEGKALGYGATDFVRKPYNPEGIRIRLSNVIRTYRMLHQGGQPQVDEVTSLMSVTGFYQEGTIWMEEEPDANFDVVAIDIDNFRLINDSKGMEGGDELLRAVGARCKAAMEETKFLATRIYADRFVCLFKRREGYLDRLIEQADKISIDFSQRINVNFKIGVFEIDDRSMRLPRICERAFSALATIKGEYGTRYTYYDKELHNRLLFEEKVNEDMVQALEEKQFKIYLQPKYDTFSNAIVGAEALVRWEHPVEGMISPGAFIPIFEKNGFITDLDRYVWEETASLISSWVRSGNKVIPVSVNISRRDINDIDVVEYLSQLVEKYNLSPELLHLEITESAYMEDTDKIVQVSKDLKESGFTIEMDDFGSGYSSLNMLAKMTIDILKLDMKFIQNIETSTSAKTIIEYTIGLAKWMNLPVVAEGVETKEQLELLKRFECDYVQGFIFAKPMPIDEFMEVYMNSLRQGKKTNGEQDVKIHDNEKQFSMLIVEDLQLNRAIVRSYFEESFNIIEAVNGEAAMEYLETQEAPDIILLDIYMPKMDGYEVLQKLKADKKLHKIPVLVISSKTNEEEEERVYELGADAFSPKPFTAEKIIEKVRLLLHYYDAVGNMSSVELIGMLKNPWMNNFYDEIYIINAESQMICEIQGERIVETQALVKDKVSTNIMEKYYDEIITSKKRHAYIKDNRMMLDIQTISMQGKDYIVCFVRDLEHIERI